MPVTFDTSGIYTSSTTTGTVALTIASNACLIVGVATNAVLNKSVSAIYVNAVDITSSRLQRIEATKDGIGVTSEIYCMTAAPSGAVTITVTLIGVAANMVIIGASYIGAKSVNPFSVTDARSATGVSNVVVSISTSTTDRVVFFASANVGTISATNATQRQKTAEHFGCFLADTAGPASSISLSATLVAFTTSNAAYIGLNIAFSAASTARVPQLALLGAGT